MYLVQENKNIQIHMVRGLPPLPLSALCCGPLWFFFQGCFQSVFMYMGTNLNTHFSVTHASLFKNQVAVWQA